MIGAKPPFVLGNTGAGSAWPLGMTISGAAATGACVPASLPEGNCCAIAGVDPSTRTAAIAVNAERWGVLSCFIAEIETRKPSAGLRVKSAFTAARFNPASKWFLLENSESE